MSDVEPVVGSMALAFANGLVGEVGSELGAALISSIFPALGTVTYFDEVYTAVTKIVNQALTANDVTLISGTLDGVQQWAKNTYAPLKADPATPFSDLNQILGNMVAEMNTEVLGKLTAIGVPGLSVYLLATGVQLSLVQEQAYTDPSHSTDRQPDNGGYLSPYADSVRKYAQTFHDLIVSNWQALKNSRANAVSAVQVVPAPAHPLFWWEDSIDGTDWKTSPPTYNQIDETIAAANAARDAHIAAVIAALSAQLGDPDTIAAQLLELQKWPLPVTTAKVLSFTNSAAAGLTYDGGFQQKYWTYSVTWSTSGGDASLDGGVGPVEPSGTRTFNGSYTMRPLPTTLTVTGPYGPPVIRQIPINWG